MTNSFFGANNRDVIRTSFWMNDEGAVRVESLTGVTYIGYAMPGAGEDENLWKIKQITDDGTLTTMLYPNNDWGIPDKAFSYNWTNRSDYDYIANAGKLSFPPVAISVYENDTKFSIIENKYVQSGTNLELKAIGGQLGDAVSTGSTCQWTWYDDQCNGNVIGYGESINVYPTGTTTYYLNYSGGINSASVCLKRTILVF